MLIVIAYKILTKWVRIFGRGEIQSSHLGCDIQCWDPELEAPSSPDEPGELVCVKPFPSMPVYFWNDPDYKLYRAAYMNKIRGKMDRKPKITLQTLKTVLFCLVRQKK